MKQRDARTRLRLPRPDRIPNASNERTVPKLDTGGAFRPDWRKQNPASDPKEPYGSESGGTGEDHGWSNCTMAAAALAYAYAVGDKSGPYPGDMRHNQDDLAGGTDLYDADTAFHRYGDQNLDVRIGFGWSDLKAKRAEGRAIIVQGEGNVPGTESFDGGHACVIGLETHSDGKWLFGDPLASGWQWVTELAIRDWAERLSSGIYYAATKVAPMPPPTAPPPDGGSTMGTKVEAIEPASGKARLDEDGIVWRVVDDAQVQAVAGADWVVVGRCIYHVTAADPGGAPGFMIIANAADRELHVVARSRCTFTADPVGGDCPECPPVPDIEAEIAAALVLRDQEWIDGLTEVWPAGAVSLLDGS